MMSPAPPGLVHKIDRHDHRALQLQKLDRQIHVAFQIGGVHDVDDRVGRSVSPPAPMIKSRVTISSME
jgi:hypothetical protein